LTLEDFAVPLRPFTREIDIGLSKWHNRIELFAILGIVLNFGLDIAREGLVYTTVYVDSVRQFNEFIQQIFELLIQSLVDSVAPSISLHMPDEIANSTALQGDVILSKQYHTSSYRQWMT
jgi:hypothetical protein